MAIGLNISDNIRVELGEFKEQLVKDLNDNKISYTIPFDKTNKRNIKETIITITELGVEISVENDIVVYIKSASNQYSNVDTLTDDQEISVLEHIATIKDKVNQKFNGFGEEYTIKFEKIDTKSMNMVVILNSAYEKARLTILMDANRIVYINTIRQLM